jgi:beta-lactamase superfamily II metal-dependent hydrolase
MLFSLEVLEAKYGDCLMLHFGDPNDPKSILIDGGPPGVYSKTLKPRLMAIKAKLTGDEPLPLAMVMISHADEDHIQGIIDLTDSMADKLSEKEQQDFIIDNFWFNSFDDIIGNLQIPIIKDLKTSAHAADISSLQIPKLDNAPEHIVAVIASTGQGRHIRDNVAKLNLSVNAPFQNLKPGNTKLVRGDTKTKNLLIGDLEIIVVHPTAQRLQELQTQWDKDLKKAAKAKSKEKSKDIIVSSLINNDKSPFNLSSIVCLVKFGDKKMLLTGDGRSDDIYAGLKLKGLLDKEGKIHVDILKMPHHGSKADMTPEFLMNVTADHYVVSASGKFNNPDQETLDMMDQAVKKGTLHLTNHDGELGLKKKMDDFIEKLSSNGNLLQVAFRNDADLSFIINLEDKVNF